MEHNASTLERDEKFALERWGDDYPRQTYFNSNDLEWFPEKPEEALVYVFGRLL